jgi:hypothetical protein
MSQTEIVRELQVSLEETCLYKRLLLDYTYVLIETSSFEREYNLKYLAGIGNVFDPADIDAAIANEYDIIQYLDDIANPPRIQGVMGLPWMGSLIIWHSCNAFCRWSH